MGAVPCGGTKHMTRKQKILSAIGMTVFGAVVLLAFSGYVNPAMLLDFANARFCG
jgi:hypothetical protein